MDNARRTAAAAPDAGPLPRGEPWAAPKRGPVDRGRARPRPPGRWTEMATSTRMLEEPPVHHAGGFFNQPWVQNVLPLATSLFLHIAIIGVGILLYTAVRRRRSTRTRNRSSSPRRRR